MAASGAWTRAATLMVVADRRGRCRASVNIASWPVRPWFIGNVASTLSDGSNGCGLLASNTFDGRWLPSASCSLPGMSTCYCLGAPLTSRLVPSLDLTACSRAQRAHRRLRSTRRHSTHSERAEKLRGERSECFGSGWHLDLAAACP